jgi:hypothetical protein
MRSWVDPSSLTAARADMPNPHASTHVNDAVPGLAGGAGQLLLLLLLLLPLLPLLALTPGRALAAGRALVAPLPLLPGVAGGRVGLGLLGGLGGGSSSGVLVAPLRRRAGRADGLLAGLAGALAHALGGAWRLGWGGGVTGALVGEIQEMMPDSGGGKRGRSRHIHARIKGTRLDSLGVCGSCGSPVHRAAAHAASAGAAQQYSGRRSHTFVSAASARSAGGASENWVVRHPPPGSW